MTALPPNDAGAPSPDAGLVVARALVRHLLRDGRLADRGRCVVGVAGESGSGKSVTALALARALGDAGTPAGVLHQDDYFHLPPRTNHLHRVEDLAAHVGPQEVNLALVAEHVAAFRAGASGLTGPRADHAGNRFLTRPLDFAPLRALVVEGTYVLGLPDLDVRIFLEATWEDTRERRRLRGRDIIDPVIDEILRIEHGIISRQAAVADVVVDREFGVKVVARDG